MPPSLTYSFLPGLEGSNASILISSKHRSKMVLLTNVVRPFQFDRDVLVANII